MARIAGINIPTNKRIEIALTYIHGIGLNSSKNICNAAGVSNDKRVNTLTETDLSQIRDVIDKDFIVLFNASSVPKPSTSSDSNPNELKSGSIPNASMFSRVPNLSSISSNSFIVFNINI